jgi:D-sedoheptulose 7-phosphate isomerase
MSNFEQYVENLISAQRSFLVSAADLLSDLMADAITNNRNVYLCGNGGSGANALHMVNDFMLFGQENNLKGVNIESLNANTSVLTCIANDVSFDNIFVNQLQTKIKKDDFLVVLSGSGNSKNIIKAIDFANKKGAITVGIFGFDGGIGKSLVQKLIHFNVNNMQIVEDLQISLCHMVMNRLRSLYIESKQK